jgi:hypothetical protein
MVKLNKTGNKLKDKSFKMKRKKTEDTEKIIKVKYNKTEDPFKKNFSVETK